MTLDTVTWLVTGAMAFGYFARGFTDRYVQARRERVLFALGGDLPDWEKEARELEDAADRDEVNDSLSFMSFFGPRSKARRLRRVARRRLRNGRSALPW